MKEFFEKLFSADFMPHGYCYLWRPSIVWLHALSDGLIMVSYYVIPVLLIYFVRKRKDVPYHWMFVMFGVFIFGCGTTHLMEIWTLWYGTYRLAGLVKAITAGASLATAAALFPMIPKALRLPSPEELKQEIAYRKSAEQELQRAKDELEFRVQERTTDLRKTNEQLVAEVEQRKRAEAELQQTAQIRQSLAGRLLTVQEDERKRIARDLHDDLSQRLALHCIELDLLRKNLSDDSGIARGLARLRGNANRLTLDVRKISHNLHHPQLALGFQHGAASFCREFFEQHGITVELACEGDSKRIPEAVSVVLFRVLQEALSNVAKHSGADRVNVVARIEPSLILLRVTDRGRGFQSDGSTGNGGLGLISMRERLRLVGGTMKVVSAPGQGAEIEVVVAIPAVGTPASAS
jgi:signal transduction histidine kinase